MSTSIEFRGTNDDIAHRRLLAAVVTSWKLILAEGDASAQVTYISSQASYADVTMAPPAAYNNCRYGTRTVYMCHTTGRGSTAAAVCATLFS